MPFESKKIKMKNRGLKSITIEGIIDGECLCNI
jgi:hypothetical protein